MSYKEPRAREYALEFFFVQIFIDKYLAANEPLLGIDELVNVIEALVHMAASPAREILGITSASKCLRCRKVELPLHLEDSHPRLLCGKMSLQAAPRPFCSNPKAACCLAASSPGRAQGHRSRGRHAGCAPDGQKSLREASASRRSPSAHRR